MYDPSNENEFAQTCELVEGARVHNNGQPIIQLAPRLTFG